MGGALAGSLHKLSSFGGRFLRLTTPEVGGEVSTLLGTESDSEPEPEDINGPHPEVINGPHSEV